MKRTKFVKLHRSSKRLISFNFQIVPGLRRCVLCNVLKLALGHDTKRTHCTPTVHNVQLYSVHCVQCTVYRYTRTELVYSVYSVLCTVYRYTTTELVYSEICMLSISQ